MSSRALHLFCCFLCLSTAFLLFAGALVTTTGSGLAVPDWPLSFGTLTPKMEGGVFFEHGHRLVAGSVGVITLLVSLALWFFEPRRWVKMLGGFALLTVVIQAVLGGITVILQLPPAVSVTHACTAQIFFSLTIVLSLVTSGLWRDHQSRDSKREFHLPFHCIGLSLCLFLQIFIGAVMRHTGSGLAIADFPLSQGKWIPDFVSFGVTIHYLHRLGAVLCAAISAGLVYRIFKHYSNWTSLIVFSGIILTAISAQFILGALIIWMQRPVFLTSLHLLIGGTAFGASVALSCLSLFVAYRGQWLEVPIDSRLQVKPA